MNDISAERIAAHDGCSAGKMSPAFDYPKQYIVSYAQQHEDVLLWRALQDVEIGFYIDVGAHDPTSWSVTKAFYDHGWHGINIEPDPVFADKLRKERPRDTTLEVAIGANRGVATLYDFGETGLSTLVKEIADRHIAAGIKMTEKIVEIQTLETALEGLSEQPVHFMKIDVEGYEENVLRGGDFAKVRPWILLIEALRPLTVVPSYATWEKIILQQGYEFAYFDGLNRYYVSNEHSDLKRYFSAPVSTCDPFHDSKVIDLQEAVARLKGEKEAHARETARLSEVVHQMSRNAMRHDVPRLGHSSKIPIYCDAQDGLGMLRIVEAQASDLVRLRRKLQAAQTISAQRLQLIKESAKAKDAPSSEDQRLSAMRENSELFKGDLEILLRWVRSVAHYELIRLERAITDVVERSRWRRIGQRLGLAKRLEWETGQWRPTFNAPSNEAVGGLLAEIERLNGLLDQLRKSRWRKLGHLLGVSKRLPWESGSWSNPLLFEPFPKFVARTIPATPTASDPLVADLARQEPKQSEPKEPLSSIIA